MKRFHRRAAGVTAVALSLAALTGTAFADSGNGNSANAPGQEKKADVAPQAAPPAASAQPAAQPQQQQQERASVSTAGVKPSSTTSHHTSCTTGGTSSSATCAGNGPKADSSKQYGNGKTAAQIAVSRGAPAGTPITGPGNSQPHKVVTCAHEHAVDVHAVKGYDAAVCRTSTPAPACTANCTTPPANLPCGSVVSAQTTVVGVMHMNGKGQPVHLMTNPKSAHFQPKHGDQPVTQTRYSVVSNGDSCGGTHATVTPSNTSGQSGAILSASSAPTASPAPTSAASSAPSTGSGRPASATPSVTPSGGVLGATATLTSPKPHAGGVLGTAANIAGSTLPFTGFPVWIAVLLAVVMIAAGLMLRGHGGRGNATRI